MITIQRVRVRWGAASRGARQAAARRGLCAPAPLPALPGGEVVVHDVLADEAARYVRRDGVAGGGLDLSRDVGLSLVARGSSLVVDRLPDHAAFPRQSGPARLFTLAPGEIGEYRANFRFTVTTCPCNMDWYYEDQLILVSHGATGFLSRKPHHRADHRVHLYGGSRRPLRGSRRA